MVLRLAGHGVPHASWAPLVEDRAGVVGGGMGSPIPTLALSNRVEPYPLPPSTTLSCTPSGRHDSHHGDGKSGAQWAKCHPEITLSWRGAELGLESSLSTPGLGVDGRGSSAPGFGT